MNLADAYHAFYMAVLVCLSVLTLFCLFRAIQGPRIADRIVSINMICTLTMTMICILAAMLGEGYLVDCLLYTSADRRGREHAAQAARGVGTDGHPDCLTEA